MKERTEVGRGGGKRQEEARNRVYGTERRASRIRKKNLGREMRMESSVGQKEFLVVEVKGETHLDESGSGSICQESGIGAVVKSVRVVTVLEARHGGNHAHANVDLNQSKCFQ